MVTRDVSDDHSRNYSGGGLRIGQDSSGRKQSYNR